MGTEMESNDENIRKIEDIIDIQKANGNFNVRQVAFTLPSDTDSAKSANLARSLETGLSSTSNASGRKKKLKKLRAKRFKRDLPDVVSWPSDSDITVLRLKLYEKKDLKEKVGNLIPGDGLHQPDSSSMVNLATLMLQSQPPSKHSLIEEYLLPLSSWEEQKSTEEKKPAVLDKLYEEGPKLFQSDVKIYDAMCSYKERNFERFSSGSDRGLKSTKCKIARFLRLYFCPCCTCLYEMERNPPSELSKNHYSCY